MQSHQAKVIKLLNTFCFAIEKSHPSKYSSAVIWQEGKENKTIIGGQAPSAHGRGSTFFSARGGSIFSKQGLGQGGGSPGKKSLEFLKSAIRAEKLLQK